MHALQAASFRAAGAWPYVARCMLERHLCLATACAAPASDALKPPVVIAHTTQACLRYAHAVCVPGAQHHAGSIGAPRPGVAACHTLCMACPFESKAVSVTAQEALMRGALSGADVLLWLRVRAMPVVGWVCVKWPAFRCAHAGGACMPHGPVQAVQACRPCAMPERGSNAVGAAHRSFAACFAGAPGTVYSRGAALAPHSMPGTAECSHSVPGTLLERPTARQAPPAAPTACQAPCSSLKPVLGGADAARGARRAGTA